MTTAPPTSPIIMTDPMDMSVLVEALPTLSQRRVEDPTSNYALEITQQYEFRCGRCGLGYRGDWYHLNHTRCFFCMRFQSPSITRYALLYETQWYFIQSGQDDARSFYATYFELLHRWADHYHIPVTPKDIEYQTYLIQFVDAYDPPLHK